MWSSFASFFSYLVMLHSMHSALSERGEEVFDHWQVVVVHHLLLDSRLQQLLLLGLHGGHHLERGERFI